MPSKKSLVAILAIIIVIILVNLPVLNQPFGRDQGIFAYIGDGILNGSVPYRDSWDHKPPGIAFLYALSFSLFGRAMTSIHLLETIFVLATGIIIYFLAKRLINERTGFLSALVYGLTSTLMFEWWDRGQAEVFMSLPLSLSFWLLVKALPAGYFRAKQKGESPSKDIADYSLDIRIISFSSIFYILLAGFVAGITLYLKPTGGTGFLFLAMAPVLVTVTCWLVSSNTLDRFKVNAASQEISLDRLPSNFQHPITNPRPLTPGPLFAIWGFLTLGLLLSLVPGLVYFGVNGALSDFYQTVFVFNTDHVRTGANLTLDSMLFATFEFGSRMGIVSPLALTGIALLALHRRTFPVSSLLIFWSLSVLAGIWAQGKFFSYHWSPMIPPLSVAAGFAIADLWTEFKTFLIGSFAKLSSSLAASVLIIAVLGTGFLSFGEIGPKENRDLSYLLGKMSEREYLAKFAHNINGTDVYSFPAANETAEYLKSKTEKGDTVLLWGFQALVNYLADRRAPTRFVFSYPLTIEREDSTFREQARETFLREIDKNKPRYIVLVTNDVNPIQTMDSQSLLNTFPEFKAIVDNLYSKEKDIADFHLYVRKSP